MGHEGADDTKERKNANPSLFVFLLALWSQENSNSEGQAHSQTRAFMTEALPGRTVTR